MADSGPFKTVAPAPAAAPPPEMVTVTIDGKAHQFPKGTVLLEACNAVGSDVPFFCYHAALSSDRKSVV